MVIFVVWVVLSVAAGIYAANKGRSGVGIFVLSLLLSPLVGFLVALAMRPHEKEIAQARDMKKCPDCAEFVQPDARVCRFCKHEFSETPETPEKTSHISLYVLLGILGLVLLVYIAQPRHWESRQNSLPIPPPKTQAPPRPIPPRPAMAQGQALRRAQRMCSRITKNADTLADYVGTICKPTTGGNGSIDLVIVARKPVFLVPDAKKAWLLVIVGAVGKEMTEQPEVPIGDILLADSASAQTGIMWSFAGSLAKNLRNQLYAGEISIEEAYLKLLEGVHGVKVVLAYPVGFSFLCARLRAKDELQAELDRIREMLADRLVTRARLREHAENLQ